MYNIGTIVKKIMKRTEADDVIKKVLTENKIQRVLDIGVGDGIDAMECVKRGAEVDAIDMDDSSKEVLKENGINFLNIKIEDWINDGSQKNKYDFIILRSVIHFLKPEFVFNDLFPELPLLLNEGGFIYIFGVLPPSDSERFTYSKEEISAGLRELKEVSLEQVEKANNYRVLFRKNV